MKPLWKLYDRAMDRLAAIDFDPEVYLAGIIKQATELERERCAKVANSLFKKMAPYYDGHIYAKDVASEIRKGE